MKNPVAVFVSVMLLVFALAVQASAEEPRPYVRTISLERVYTHSAGYMVVYRTSRLETVETYIPARWFEQAAGRGQLVFTQRRAAPYMQVYYDDGEFSHVRLFVRSNTAHPSWGFLPNRPEVRERFDEVGDTLRVRY